MGVVGAGGVWVGFGTRFAWSVMIWLFLFCSSLFVGGVGICFVLGVLGVLVDAVGWGRVGFVYLC